MVTITVLCIVAVAVGIWIKGYIVIFASGFIASHEEDSEVLDTTADDLKELLPQSISCNTATIDFARSLEDRKIPPCRI